jgi:uncharacterized protein YjiS (DUF1127 family)
MMKGKIMAQCDCNVAPHGGSARATGLTGLLAPVVTVLGMIADAAELARQRRALRNLDDRLLGDIGLDRAGVARELSKTRWNAPSHWMR